MGGKSAELYEQAVFALSESRLLVDAMKWRKIQRTPNEFLIPAILHKRRQANENARRLIWC